jgi:hypothetical protein
VSTLISYICFLLDNLRALKSPDLLEPVLTLLLTSFEKSVQSLRLRCACCSSSASSHQCPLETLPPILPEETCSSAEAASDLVIDDDDDVGWFFSDDVVPTSSAVPQTGGSEVYTPDTPVPIVPTISAQSRKNDAAYMLDIWKGLEHCLHWDFAFSGHDDTSFEIFLPMKVALSAASHILVKDIMSVTENMKVVANHFEPPLLKNISFEWIQGKSIGDTAFYEDTVIEFCESVAVKKDKDRRGRVLEAPHVAAQGARVYASYQQALEVQSAKAGRPLAGLYQLAVVDAAVCTDDKSTAQLRVSGSGGSQQADALQQQVSHIHSSTTSTEAFETILQLNKTHTYTEKALAHLLDLNVQVLLCPYSVPLKLVDACYENGICVIPMSTENLHIMAKLAEADVMEDVLDLYPECLGCRTTGGNRNNPKFVHIRAQDCVRRVLSDDPDAIYKSQNSVMLLVQITKDNNKNTSNDVDEHYATSSTHMPYANSSSGAEKRGKRHVSVLVTCPTAVMGSMMEDRIRKCVSRIDLVRQGSSVTAGGRGGWTAADVTSPPCPPKQQSRCRSIRRNVVPGGGVVELLCAMHIQTFKNENTAETFSALMYADKLIQSLQDFAYTVNTNNGLTPGHSMTRWSTCMKEVLNAEEEWKRMIYSQSSGGNSSSPSTTLMDFASSLDTMQLLNLPRPIELDGHAEPRSIVLDVASLKMEAMRVACFAVKTILGTSYMVSLT